MIYFDNAATTKYKPEAVYEATNFYLREVGVSPGRGSYGMGIEASRMLYKSRCAVGKYFGMSRPDKVLFTKNSTEAMNLFFNGFLKKGDHVVISCYEHNAVLRPIQKLKEQGVIDCSIVQREDLELPESQGTTRLRDCRSDGELVCGKLPDSHQPAKQLREGPQLHRRRLHGCGGQRDVPELRER